MAAHLKNIYKAKNLGDLQKLASIANLDKSVKQIITTADKLYAEAEKQLLNRDEELAYIFFFRYVEAISLAQKKDEFKKDKAYFEKLISKQKFGSAIKKLEVLTDSLEKRYTLKKEIEDLDSAARKKEFIEALENDKNFHGKKGGSDSVIKGSSGDSLKSSLSSLNGIVKSNGVEKEEKPSNGITAHDLKNLLEQRTKRILLVDCRDRTDFTNNHINHSNCICIPVTALSEGMSANMILKGLKDCSPESYMDWTKRGTFDYIILYDWNSNFDNRSPGLKIVYDALTKWDQDCKNTKVLVVQGGMKTMYYTFPTLLTNPQTSVNNGPGKVNGNNDLVDLRKLDSISYPDLDDNPPKISSARSSQPKEIQDSNHDQNRALSVNSNHPDVQEVPKNAGVAIDRSTKPLYSSHKVPNGTAIETLSPSSGIVNFNESSNTDKTDVKLKEYSKALDAVIESTKHAIKSEEEVKDLADIAGQVHDTEIVTKLKAKETEADALRLQLEARNSQLSVLKAQYEAVLREQKTKHILPRIRTPAEEEVIAAKQKEKEKLDEMMKTLRKLKLEKIEKEKSEELLRAERVEKDSATSKLPPIHNTTSSGQVIRGSSGTGTPQLPAINNTTRDITSSPVPTVKPSSSSTVPSASSSRPVSQDSSAITRQKLKDESLEPPRSSSLKRSHSHPNIAQSHEEDMGDESSGTSQPPRINRGLKPRSHAPEVATPRRFARNFEVVSSTEKSKTGLKNLGNTCYMNSIIQCLSHTNKLVDYLRSEEYTKEWHPSRSPTKGEATEELAAAVKQMHSGHRAISLLDLKSIVGKHHRSFLGYEQQDSHEFLTIVLDWLHEEMNRVPEKTPLKEQKNDGLSDEVAAARAWEDYKKSNNSKISELFCGQQKSCVTCANCNRQSVTFEPFFILSVPIPVSSKKCDIQQCIDFYTTEEELSGWNCVHCKKKVRATKKIDLWRLPPYLIIHFQRFYFDGYWKKRLTEIDFPVEHLNLNQKVLGTPTVTDKCPSYDYQLYGVSNHYGSMDGGHYTAYCRRNGWWKFDDQEVCPINSRDVPTAAAYIMFYQNRNYC